MSSIFTKIINGEIPCFKVAESKDYFAFLDIRPLTKGHTLVVPKVEVDYIFDLDNECFVGLQLFSKIVAEAIQKSVDCKRVGIAVIGLEVPHAHIHLIPINNMNEMNFSNPKLDLSKSEMQAISDKIKSYLPD
jgi:histidine triad (HIT) family protein